MFYLLKKLEDKNRPLIGPNVKALKFWGILLPKNLYTRYLCILMYLLVVIFVGTEYVDIWFVKADLNLLLNNMKITMLATMSVVKVSTFYRWQQHWLDILNYVTRADLTQRKTNDVNKIEMINKFTTYSRKITYAYWSLVYTTVIFVVGYPIFKYVFFSSYRQNVLNGCEPFFEIVSSWVPFDKSTIWGYILASIYQAYSSIVGGGWITSFDSNAMVIMVFFRAELELLRIDCANIFGTEKAQVSDEVAMVRLKECQRRHAEVMKYIHLFDECLSPVMLCYTIICSVMLCVTAYQITTEPSFVQRLVFTEYLVFCVTQLFIYCWHSNDVLYASRDLSLAPYESIWWSRGVEHRKNLFILTAQFSKVVEFSVGPFTKLTVATFIQILKGAYSYYTLLSKSDE
ncbi:unnamed protein product [Chilo suppressalis]|uniref:Odorant receptor n=1 Tax=Chilo suppressalis TaxID=168631 RepID=A0ABN8B2P7_CHISP|nr:unnamed protein product [Chilo suppressalis]